jgi:hypothetical protein
LLDARACLQPNQLLFGLIGKANLFDAHGEGFRFSVFSFQFSVQSQFAPSPHASSPGMSESFPVRERERTSHRPGWLVQPDRTVPCSRDPTKLRSLPDKLSRGAQKLIHPTNSKTAALAGQASKGRKHKPSFTHFFDP